MNLFFGENELATLGDLQTIATKHNMKIMFGYRNYTMTELELDAFSTLDLDERVALMLEQGIDLSIKECLYTYDELWFELYDVANGRSHTMAYACHKCGSP